MCVCMCVCARACVCMRTCVYVHVCVRITVTVTDSHDQQMNASSQDDPSVMKAQWTES